MKTKALNRVSASPPLDSALNSTVSFTPPPPIFSTLKPAPHKIRGLFALAFCIFIGAASCDNSPGPDLDDPIDEIETLKPTINLTTGGEWENLLSEINTAGKDVNLDLSDCTADEEFDPGAANTGEEYIVSLVLPKTSTSIKDGTWENSTFKNFTALKKVSGANITAIGDYAFSFTNLATVSFPKAMDIGIVAFYGCTSLTMASFPKATNIGQASFYSCESLATASFPEITDIGKYTFYDCPSLIMASFPKVTDIGEDAFAGCTSLVTASFPKVTSIGERVFQSCTSLTTVSFPVATSIGASAFTNTGGKPLTITLGAAAPTVGENMFAGVEVPKTVTVKTPSPTDYNEDWQNAFKGKGSDNSGTANGKINLTVTNL